MTITIHGVLASKIGFVSHQLDAHVLRELQLSNEGTEAVNQARLELSAAPEVIEPSSWNIDLIRSAETLHLTDRTITLNAAYLTRLEESVRADMTFKLIKDDKILAQTVQSVTLLATREVLNPLIFK